MEKLWVHNSGRFSLNCAGGPGKKTVQLKMEKIELVSSVPYSRDGFTEDTKLKTLFLKFWQKSPEKF